MKWFSALMLGAIIGFIMPLMFGGPGGVWMDSWAHTGTIVPFENSPGLLFSIPFGLGSAILFRMFFSWHRD